MCVLIQTLKKQYEKDDLVDFIYDWYRYAGGYKMDEISIRRKVYYHWNRDYGVFHWIEELAEELGFTEVFNLCPVHGKKK